MLGDDKGVWCGDDETCDHIILRCVVARFAWSVLRATTGCTWNPGSLLDEFRLIKASSGQDRKLAWVGFAALAWSLWRTRNKALVVGIFFSDIRLM